MNYRILSGTLKKYTSKTLVEAIKNTNESRRDWLLNKFAFEAKRSGRTSNYKLWQDGFHPVILDSNEKIDQRINYIHNNSVKAGFVRCQRDFINSSYLACEDENYNLLNVPVNVLN